ncbi:MAG: hypothetical protein ABSG85_00155 [Spirochaetia bacterium]
MADVEEIEDAFVKTRRFPACRSWTHRLSTVSKSVSTRAREAAASSRFKVPRTLAPATPDRQPRKPAFTSSGTCPASSLSRSHDADSSTSRPAARRCHAAKDLPSGGRGRGRTQYSRSRSPSGARLLPASRMARIIGRASPP